MAQSGRADPFTDDPTIYMAPGYRPVPLREALESVGVVPIEEAMADLISRLDNMQTAMDIFRADVQRQVDDLRNQMGAAGLAQRR